MIYSCRHKETNGSSELITAQIIARLDRVGIANTQINEMADLWGHIQFEARRRWREVDTPAGRIPALGEHSAALLAELGYSEADIARLRQERVI